MEYKYTKACKELKSIQINVALLSLSLSLSTTLTLLLMFDCSFWNACKMDFRFNVRHQNLCRRVLTGFSDTCIILLSFYGSNVLLVFKIVEFRKIIVYFLCHNKFDLKYLLIYRMLNIKIVFLILSLKTERLMLRSYKICIVKFSEHRRMTKIRCSMVNTFLTCNSSPPYYTAYTFE